MSLRPVALGAAIVGAALVVLMLALGDDPPPPRRPAPAEPSGSGDIGSEAPVAPAPTGSRATRGEAPALADKAAALDTTAAGEAPLWSAHEAEPRDDGWANAKEVAIRERLAPLLDAANRHRPGAVAVPHVDCRTRSCRLLVSAGDRTELGRFLESLQDERGFYGDAAELALDGYDETVDKHSGATSTQVRVHLRWAR